MRRFKELLAAEIGAEEETKYYTVFISKFLPDVLKILRIFKQKALLGTKHIEKDLEQLQITYIELSTIPN